MTVFSTFTKQRRVPRNFKTYESEVHYSFNVTWGFGADILIAAQVLQEAGSERCARAERGKVKGWSEIELLYLCIQTKGEARVRREDWLLGIGGLLSVLISLMLYFPLHLVSYRKEDFFLYSTRARDQPLGGKKGFPCFLISLD